MPIARAAHTANHLPSVPGPFCKLSSAKAAGRLRTGRFPGRPTALRAAVARVVVEWLPEKPLAPARRNAGPDAKLKPRVKYGRAVPALPGSGSPPRLTSKIQRWFLPVPGSVLLVRVRYPKQRLFSERFAQKLQPDRQLGRFREPARHADAADAR